ncbi:MAG: PAS domain S-box protein [Alphaproteobacteria bacterium]|nr:PAS domain S-box protein [Alphaproteobacteria bacterium]
MSDNQQDAAGETEPATKRPINKFVVITIVAILALIGGAVGFTFKFVNDERERSLQEWQVRLSIVADSRSAAVDEWMEQNFANLRELAENASVQLYMTEIIQAQAKGSGAVAEAAAQAQYLRNLLIAVAERTGFKPPPAVGEVAANVERAGVAGVGLVDANGSPISSSPGMPPISADMRIAIAKALEGKPALIDVFVGSSAMPAVGFVLPVFGIQDSGSKGIGAVVGIRLLGSDLFDRLKQPGATEKTGETYLVRKDKQTAQYLTPLADGTPPLKKALDLGTANLDGAWALEKPGGFAIKRDYAGADALVVSRAISNTPWVLIRKVSRNEALSATDTRLTTILTVFLLFIGVISATIFGVWRHGSSVRALEAAENFRTAAERFQNMTKFMRLVTNSQPTEIVAVDGNTRYTFANEPAARQAGLSVEDMMGKTMGQVIGPIKAQAFAEINKAVLQNFERQEHLHYFEVDENPDGQPEIQVMKSVHVPLRGDRDYPPGILMILDDITELTNERRKSERMLRSLINTLVSVVDRRDPFSANHSVRVSEVAKCIAKEMGADDVEMRTVDTAGSLMNLGKIFIPPDLLTKTADLAPDERKMLLSSHLVAADLLENVKFEGPVVETIRQMGETWDGKGPLGLKGEEILRTARMLAVANAFVGMVSPRAYRDAMTFEKCCSILLGQTETRYDRKPVSALINYLENRDGMERWAHYRKKPDDIAA